jgi:hypothetical protein
MKGVYIQTGIAMALLSFLFVFFVPVVYSSSLPLCQSFMGVGGGACFVSNPAGWESVGTALFRWGAIYGFEGGYMASIPYWGFVPNLWILIFVVLPAAIASILLLRPEIARVSLSLKKRAFHGGV